MDQRAAPACGGSREPRGAGRPDPVRPRLRALRLGGAGRPAGGDPRSRIQRTPFTVWRRVAAGPGRAAVVGALTPHVAAAMRTCDLAANLGGRRFGLLFAGLDREKASIIVDRVVRVAQRELRQTTVSPLPMRLSVVGSAEQDESPDALLQRAASALADIS